MNVSDEFIKSVTHRRKNILTGDWILVSPHRTQRPWQGDVAKIETSSRPKYDPECYLCPGNKRANGEVNPDYKATFSFTNDFSALLENKKVRSINNNNLLIAKSESGICRVVNFSPRHDLTLAEMSLKEIENVISIWQEEFKTLGSNPKINHVQIFENKGAMMGNSNPHAHCQIWAQKSIPIEPRKELTQFKKYFETKKRSILADYLKLELKQQERIVFQNETILVVVPFWAIWPFETLLIPKRKMQNILELKENEKVGFAEAIKAITSKYDKMFSTSFPYSSGIHQAPTDGKKHNYFHWHMHFYPPLLRSSTIKKFMVGYEMLCEPQRDITPELSAQRLGSL